MTFLVSLVAVLGTLLLSGFFLVLVWKLLTREIRLRYLLEDDYREDARFSNRLSLGRLQLLVVVAALTLYCLIQIVQDPTLFPTVPHWSVFVIGMSQAVYLGGKVHESLLTNKSNHPTRRFLWRPKKMKDSVGRR